MTKRVTPSLCALLLCAVSLSVSGCGGAHSNGFTDICAGKGAVPPAPFVFLDYPPSGSTNVATNVGRLIETGADNGPNVYPTVTLNVSAPSGPLQLGAPAIAPSPFPTPFATPFPAYTGTYVAVALPTLSPNTTYTVTDTYMGFADSPPTCSAPVTQNVGTFATGP
jgi:hypothetical protein